MKIFKPEVVSFIKQEFGILAEYAEGKRTCKRKAVGCSIIEIHTRLPGVNRIVLSHNGPSGFENECSGVVGNCGCSHAEPRAVFKYLNKLKKDYGDCLWSIMICNYSPCTNCANIIVDSGIITAVVYKILTEHDIRGVEILKRSLDIFSITEL